MATPGGIRERLAALDAAKAASKPAKKSATKPAKKAASTVPTAAPPVKVPAKRVGKKTTAPTATTSRRRAVMATTDKYDKVGAAVAEGLRKAEEDRERAEHDRLVAAVMAAVGGSTPAPVPAAPAAPTGAPQHGLAPYKAVNGFIAFETTDHQHVAIYKDGTLTAMVAKGVFDADPDKFMSDAEALAPAKGGLIGKIKKNLLGS